MSWSRGAQTMTPAVARSAEIKMLASSQKPERVLNILRSSTRITLTIGTGLPEVVAGRSGCAAMAFMPLLLLAGNWR